MDPYKILRYSHMTEKSVALIEKENKIVFIVDRNANKESIKNAVEILYKVKVEKVNSVKTVRSNKAYVKLSEESSAADLASKLGLV